MEKIDKLMSTIDTKLAEANRNTEDLDKMADTYGQTAVVKDAL